MFKVTEIISGNTIRVSPKWSWEGQTGDEIVIDGYDLLKTSLPHEISEPVAKGRLQKLIKDKEVSLSGPANLEEKGKRIKCRVYLDSVNIANYFPEFKK